MQEKQPQSHEAERAMLHLLLYERGIDLAAVLHKGLCKQCFYDAKLGAIFEAVEAIGREGRTPDLVSVCEWLTAHRCQTVAPYDVAELMNVDVSSTPGYLANVLLGYHWRRQAIALCQQTAMRLYEGGDAPEDIIEGAATMLADVTRSRQVQHTTLTDATNLVMQQMLDNLNPDTRHHGSMTGFRQIDDTGGLPEVGVTVIAADTSQGKSSLGIDLAMRNIADGDKVGYFSLEMPPEDLARRIVSASSGIAAYRIAYHQLSEQEQESVGQSTLHIVGHGGDRFFFDSQMESSVEQICASIRHLADPRGERVTHFYVDYMQILSWASDTSRPRQLTVEQLLANAARAFHNLSVRLKVQIVLLSQVNRDNDCRELTLDRIRDSKQIADAATCVVLLYRPEAYGKTYQTERFRNVDPSGTALINVAKRRNGPCCQFICGFDREHTHFFQLDSVPTVSSTTSYSSITSLNL